MKLVYSCLLLVLFSSRKAIFLPKCWIEFQEGGKKVGYFSVVEPSFNGYDQCFDDI